MKSPFPGMDPFLELSWHDLRAALITYIRDQLQDELPADLRAQINERVVLQQDHEPLIGRGTQPDVAVSETRQGTIALAASVEADAEATPDLIVEDDYIGMETETYVEIVNAKTGSQVITVIELLSPTNKLPGKGCDSYLAKQATYLEAGVQLVEIDLTRQGDRSAVMTKLPYELPQPHPAYLALVHRISRNSHQLRREYYQLPMERPLKAIRIPLRPSDRDVILRLQPLVELAYQKGRYGDLDYTQQLTPPLSYAEQAFLAQCLAARQ